MHWLLFLAGLCAPLVHAIHESEVGVVDWHKLQIGVPLTGSLSTSPSFHVPRERQSPDGLLLSATSSNVLAAVYAGNGSVAWRYIYDARDPVILYKQHNDIVATLSGPGGSTLRTFDSSTGHLILEKRLHKPDITRIFEPSDVGTSISFPSDDTSDVLVLTSAYIIRRISSKGNVAWTWTSPDQTSSVIYSQIITTPDVIYALGLTKSFRSYNLHVTTLSPTTGSVLASADIASDITSGPNSLLPLTSPKGPQVAWLEGEYLRTVVLTPSLSGKAALHTGAEYASIVDVGLSAQGHFVALKADGTGRVLKLDEKGVKLVWEFENSAKSEHNAPSLYSGGLDADGHPYIARVFWSHALQKASVHVYAPHLADGKGLVSGFTFSFQTNVHGIIKHAALYAALPKPYDVIPYLALTTSTGAVQLWQGEHVLWTREEGLSRIGIAEMVEMPERKTAAAARGAETFLQRVMRQARDAKDFPQYLIHFVKRFATGSYASATSRATPSTENDSLTRDAFGFRKVIVAATELGKVYGLDSSSGEVLWSRVLGLGWAAQTGGRIVPMKIFVTRTVADAEPEEGGPQAVLVAQRIADNGLVDTVVFHFEALTGKEVNSSSPPGDILHGTDIISGPLLGAYLLEKETKVVVLVDEFRQVYLYPDTAASSKVFDSLAPSLYIPLRTGPPGHRQFTGHQPVLDAGLQGRAQLHPTFATSLPPHEEILALVTRPSDPVASPGKVLGNRTTLYKYLNPHVFAVLTADTAGGRCGVHVLDGAKGSVVYSAVVPAEPGKTCNVHAAFVENWLVYVYWDPEWRAPGTAKGHRVVSVELYEGKGADDKTSSADMSSYSNRSLDLHAYEQSYVFPGGVTAISVTSTKFGVTMKDIIVAKENGQIQSFPRRALDPRRPNRKPTAEEQEELLFQYDPIVPDDPRRVLSHKYDVSGVRHILTSPALLESTSLVFAYGLDLFGTRVAPSGTFDVLSENFNKAQLVLTVTGLAMAILITKPMVNRKRLREKWYQ